MKGQYNYNLSSYGVQHQFIEIDSRHFKVLRGSNQYCTRKLQIIKKRHNFKNIKGFLALTTIFITSAYLSAFFVASAISNNTPVVSPLAENPEIIIHTPTPTTIPTPTETPQQIQIRDYIKQTFKNDSDYAFKILSCENPTLDPEKVNTAGNTPAGSRDIGVFQVNEFWQKIQGKFLFNWKINIEAAYQLFIEDHHSFKQWACDKKINK